LQASLPQAHLSARDMVNRGSYYTPDFCVSIVADMLRNHVDSNSVILDSACGYGSFFQIPFFDRIIGLDLDEIAIKKTQSIFPSAQILQRNALSNVSRHSIGIANDQHLVIVGNPPYNDRTSQIRKSIKTDKVEIDDDLRSRDLGLSFLLSYAKIKADIICVLHPLSYLIKKANFNALQGFTSSYRLIRGFIVSSGRFEQSSKITQFPIVIALYIRCNRGMKYDDIMNFSFLTDCGNRLRLSGYDFISKYIQKYPRKGSFPRNESAYFWPLRDINALKRNRTFLKFYRPGCIIIQPAMLKFYIYVDVFKNNLHRLPYFYGNCDVFIDRALFQEHESSFIRDSLNRHPYLAKSLGEDIPTTYDVSSIDSYFNQLMERYHVDYSQ